jgi:DNA repair photolyase
MHFKEAKTLLSSQNGMNIYRGCTHGCIYCDSRSACYKMDMTLRILKSDNAPGAFEDALRRAKNAA